MSNINIPTKTESESESSYEDVTSESSDENNSQTENLELNLNILNHFNIIYELGRGSYSIVWLAFNINDNHSLQMQLSRSQNSQ